MLGAFSSQGQSKLFVMRCPYFKPVSVERGLDALACSSISFLEIVERVYGNKTAGGIIDRRSREVGGGNMPIDCKHIKMLVVAMVSENFRVAIADSLWSYYVFLVRWELKMIIAFR